MTCRCATPHPLVRDGTRQSQRPLPALDPATAPLDGRDVEALWAYLRRFAAHVRFTPRYVAGAAADAGDWTPFLVEAPPAPDAHPPPAALLKTFLRLHTAAQAELDGLVGRQLDFWLRDVLRLRPLPARSDRAFVTFELARGAAPQVLPEGEVVLGGKARLARPTPPGVAGGDDEGPRRYALEHALRVDRVQVSDLLTIRRTPSGVLTAAPHASRPFGADTDPPARVGLVLTSPAFVCAGGTRRFTATFVTSGASVALAGVDLRPLFRVELQGPKDYVTADVEAGSLDGDTFTLTFTLDEKLPPVVAPGRCRLTLRQEVRPYVALEAVRLLRVDLAVRVTSARGARLHTAEGPADPARPFSPLGAQPMPEASFSFELPELEGKRLTKVALDVAWTEPSQPAQLDEVYAAYNLSGDLKVLSSLVELRAPVAPSALAAPGIELRFPALSGLASTLSSPPLASLFEVELALLRGSQPAGPPTEARLFDDVLACDLPTTGPVLADRLRVTLKGPRHGFGHRLYPVLQTRAVLAATSQSSATPGLPQPPLTPRARELRVDYDAIDTPRVLHLHPWGETPAEPGATTPLLPAYPNEGELYVGLRDVRPPVRLSFLFVCEEGTADPLVARAQLQWATLGEGGRFAPLASTAIADGTLALTRSGVVHVTLAAHAPVAANPGAALPPDRLWLRISAPARAQATCDLVSVVPNAAVARLLEPDLFPDHLEGGLPTGTLNKLAAPRPELKRPTQPLPSSGGSPQEPTPAFHRRVAERLRHKGRAVAVRDYEALALQAFPDLFQVKCLSHTRVTPQGDHELSPGWVTVVPVARAPRREPLVGLDRLAELEDFLRARTGPSVRLMAVNPRFERVRVRFGVRFHPGVDPASGVDRCRAAIDSRLAPWTSGGGGTPGVPFGGALHRSDVLAAVERAAGVDYVTDLRLEPLDAQRGDDAPRGAASDPEAVVASTARSVLVPALDHAITVLDAEVRP